MLRSSQAKPPPDVELFAYLHLILSYSKISGYLDGRITLNTEISVLKVFVHISRWYLCGGFLAF